MPATGHGIIWRWCTLSRCTYAYRKRYVQQGRYARLPTLHLTKSVCAMKPAMQYLHCNFENKPINCSGAEYSRFNLTSLSRIAGQDHQCTVLMVYTMAWYCMVWYHVPLLTSLLDRCSIKCTAQLLVMCNAKQTTSCTSDGPGRKREEGIHLAPAIARVRTTPTQSCPHGTFMHMCIRHLHVHVLADT